MVLKLIHEPSNDWHDFFTILVFVFVASFASRHVFFDIFFIIYSLPTDGK